MHGRESGRIVRLPHGEYVEIHEPVDAYTQYKLVDYKDYKPTLARPNAEGKITAAARVRASLSKFYFEDRIAPVTQGELDAAHHDHHEAVEAAPAAEVKAVTAKKAPAAKKPATKAAPAAKKPAATKPAAKKAPKKD